VADSASYFGFGAGEDVTVGYQIPGTMFLPFAGISYGFALGQSTAKTIFLGAGELGFGLLWPITSFLGLFAYATGGYWYGASYDGSSSSSDPYAGAGVELLLALNPVFSLSAGAQFKIYFGLWQGLAAGIGMKISLQGS
jgi:hypothetical protein